jgi:hypothetical protein
MKHTQPPHKPTPDLRRQVESASGFGLPQEQIAALIGIDPKTLRKYYEAEMEQGKAKANAQVGQSLFKKAVGGDTAAAIWWTKSQMRWSETNKVIHGGNVAMAHAPAPEMTKEEWLAAFTR